ncbi:DUF3179 domain-containing protein [Coralliovum pocilloporae]|uniref:DUF3179 domain-containing protein n=1 Tax=Coralliovum pocilloporae TaxID=3066369 RepID=UPI00330716F8
MITRRAFATLAATTALLPEVSLAQSIPEASGLYRAQWDLIFGTDQAFNKALEQIHERGNPDMAASIIQALRFSNGSTEAMVETLEAITGTKSGKTWFDWMLWQETHPEVIPHPTYTRFKREIFLRIDPNFSDFLKPDYLARDRMKIRLEEITWGGVYKDGIPSLDNPTLIPATDADYMLDTDLVFGVSINGDTRAYPLRIMGWHEMFNEVIGGVPVALAYCTLCGSGILFETDVKGRQKPFVFGSSGFLYRSNKLMFDRETHSLWNQFTGKPVVGPLVDRNIELKQRPVVITSWAEWRRNNPDTRILSLKTGHRRDYGSGVVYQDYFASNDLMFPTRVDQTRHRQKDYVFGIRTQGAAKAWPLKVFAGGKVINDRINATPLVLIGDEATRTVRAYESQGLVFKIKGDGLISGDGRAWTISEDNLKASDGQNLPRVAGHIAYWFAWNGYLGAESELYES